MVNDLIFPFVFFGRGVSKLSFDGGRVVVEKDTAPCVELLLFWGAFRQFSRRKIKIQNNKRSGGKTKKKKGKQEPPSVFAKDFVVCLSLMDKKEKGLG